MAWKIWRGGFVAEFAGGGSSLVMGNILKIVDGCGSRDVSSFLRILARAFESEGTVLDS